MCQRRYRDGTKTCGGTRNSCGWVAPGGAAPLAGVVEAFVKEYEPQEDLRQAEQALAWNQLDSVAFWLGYAVVDARSSAARWVDVQSLLQGRYNQGDVSCASLLGCAAERAERATQEATAVSMQVAAFCGQYGLPLPAGLEG